MRIQMEIYFSRQLTYSRRPINTNWSNIIVYGVFKFICVVTPRDLLSNTLSVNFRLPSSLANERAARDYLLLLNEMQNVARTRLSVLSLHQNNTIYQYQSSNGLSLRMLNVFVGPSTLHYTDGFSHGECMSVTVSRHGLYLPDILYWTMVGCAFACVRAGSIRVLHLCPDFAWN